MHQQSELKKRAYTPKEIAILPLRTLRERLQLAPEEVGIATAAFHGGRGLSYALYLLTQADNHEALLTAALFTAIAGRKFDVVATLTALSRTHSDKAFLTNALGRAFHKTRLDEKEDEDAYRDIAQHLVAEYAINPAELKTRGQLDAKGAHTESEIKKDLIALYQYRIAFEAKSHTLLPLYIAEPGVRQIINEYCYFSVKKIDMAAEPEVAAPATADTEASAHSDKEQTPSITKHKTMHL